MTKSRLLCAALAASALSPGIRAQVFDSRPLDLFLLAPTTQDELITDMVPANLDPDGAQDLLVVRGGNPAIFGAPASTTARTYFAEDATDVELLPGRDGDLTDRFLTAGTDGLRVWDDDAFGNWSSTLYQTGYLHPLSQVAVRTMGTVDVVATLNADGTHYQVHYLAAATSSPVFTSAAIPLPSTGGKIALADVTGSGFDSVIVTHDAGLGVYDALTGVLQESHPRAYGGVSADPSADQLIVIETATGHEVVWVEPAFGGAISFLQVIRQGADQLATALGTSKPVFGAACNADGGTVKDDVIFSLRNPSEALILLNQGGTNSLSLGSTAIASYTAPNGLGQNEAPVAATDFDGDGDLDICLGVGDPTQIVYFEGRDQDASEFMMDFDLARFTVDVTTSTMDFTVGLDAITGTPPVTPTELVVRAYARTGLGGALEPLSGYPQVFGPNVPVDLTESVATPAGAPFVFLQAQYVRRVAGEAPRALPALNIVVISDLVLFDNVANDNSIFDLLNLDQQAEASMGNMGGERRPDDMEGSENMEEENTNKPADGGVVVRIPVVPLD